MYKICNNLYVGSDMRYKSIRNEKDWCVIHACKEPYHRQLLRYTSRGCPSSHPEYYFAERDNILYLNLVDANDVDYIPQVVIDKAIDFIKKHISKYKVLVHCNQGYSRSPSIALLYLRYTGQMNLPIEQAYTKFKEIYPKFQPNKGMNDYIIKHWGD